ncbi:MAG: transketolase [Bacteroidetes bacterium]|nr:transketolase [Bacteroidota bacterium]
MYFLAKAGHIGCSLSCIDLLIACMIHHKKEKDDFILSKGHAAAALYTSLNHIGEISDELLKTFYKNGTLLPAHPAPNAFKSIPFATGSLGHGFPIACGIAKSNVLLNNKAWVYVLMSDGETNEGTTWEAAHFAVQHKLNNLIVLIDKNKIQGFGNTIDILGDSASKEKWEALGFECAEIDGHDIDVIVDTIEILKKSTNDTPKVIIANTTKGKGVSYMENKMEWHYLPMNELQYKQAQSEINNSYLKNER